ncbi:Ff.00g034230.m01.CDS01 [Fusarium sp. VM40]|nr:Ff.00g034230.m01.CDS01 [Fusarium sp. VM40]
MVKTHVKNWISDSLMKRRGELGRFARPTLLPKSSSTADYQNITRDVQTLFDASNRDERQILDTEVLLSIIIDLKPGLKSAISRRLDRNNSDNTARHKHEADNSLNLSNAHTELNSTEARIPPPARDQKSTTQPLTESCNSRELKGSGTIRPGATHGLPPRPPSRYDIDQSASKRKLPDPPSTSLAIPSNRTIRDTVERASNTTTQHEAKRPRLDEGRLSFADSNPLPRRQPSPPRRSRQNGGNEKKTRHSNPNDVPLKPRTPRRPASPSPPRDAPYRQRSDYREQRYARESRPHEYLDRWRPGTDRNHERPRDWRENTVEFQRMPTERQNLSLRNQMKGMEEQLKALVERNRR